MNYCSILGIHGFYFSFTQTHSNTLVYLQLPNTQLYRNWINNKVNNGPNSLDRIGYKKCHHHALTYFKYIKRCISKFWRWHQIYRGHFSHRPHLTFPLMSSYNDNSLCLWECNCAPCSLIYPSVFCADPNYVLQGRDGCWWQSNLILNPETNKGLNICVCVHVWECKMG